MKTNRPDLEVLHGKTSHLYGDPCIECEEIHGDNPYVQSLIKKAVKEGKEEGYANVAKWFKWPFREGTKSMEIKGLGISEGGCCEVCGGVLVYIRGAYPGDKNRKVCTTCAVEILEMIYGSCANRQAYTDKLPTQPDTK